MEKQNKNKNTENVLVRLFDIISVPFFILLISLIVNNQLINFEFYLEYVLYIGLISGILSITMYGYAGYRAKKNSEKNIKPYMAGFSLALIIGLISFLMTIFIPVDLDSQIKQAYQIDSINEDNEITEVEVTNENGTPIDSNPFQMFTYIIGIIGIIFGSLFGMLCGLIGGKVAQ